MSTRNEILSEYYDNSKEDRRLIRSRHGQLEYRVTMDQIHRFVNGDAKILEVGAGTGRYSIALAKEGFDVSAVELIPSNLNILKENSKDLNNIKAYEGDAIDLSRFDDDTFDVTLVLGPMYHLYDADEINMAIDEAIRVTKKEGVILFAFISIYATMFSNYFKNNWTAGQEENYDEDYHIRHFKEQLFTGYDIDEFEGLFQNKTVEWITTVATDGMLEALEKRSDFMISDEDFEKFFKWYLTYAQRREILAAASHLLYVCRKM